MTSIPVKPSTIPQAKIHLSGEGLVSYLRSFPGSPAWCRAHSALSSDRLGLIPSAGNLQESPTKSQPFGQSAWSVQSCPVTLVSLSGMCHPLGTFATSHPVAEPWLLWMPWAVGVSFLQDKVPIGDLGLYFPGDGHTKVLLPPFSWGICAVQLLANFWPLCSSWPCFPGSRPPLHRWCLQASFLEICICISLD